jgi:hypothetical protein
MADDHAATLEMLLLLLWRHLVYYSEGHHINNPDLKASTSHAMRFLTSPDADTFRSEAGIKLTPALQRLSSLDLVCFICFHTLSLWHADSFVECKYDWGRLAVKSRVYRDYVQEAAGYCGATRHTRVVTVDLELTEDIGFR